jgi:hypothetical protein
MYIRCPHGETPQAELRKEMDTAILLEEARRNNFPITKIPEAPRENLDVITVGEVVVEERVPWGLPSDREPRNQRKS